MPGRTKLVKDGDTVLVDKEKIPKRVLEASVQAVNQMVAKPRERKPPTEKQLEARAKFIELARQRAAERKAARESVKVNPDELDEIPEGKVLVKAVAGKRTGRPRKVKEPAPPSESETEVVSASAASTPAPKPAPKPRVRKAPTPVQTETEEESEAPPPRARKPAVPKAPKASQKKPARKPKSYYSETSETEAVSEESESEDEEMVKARVRKYAEKTKARLEALRQIESQLKPQNKYAGMSIF